MRLGLGLPPASRGTILTKLGGAGNTPPSATVIVGGINQLVIQALVAFDAATITPGVNSFSVGS